MSVLQDIRNCWRLPTFYLAVAMLVVFLALDAASERITLLLEFNRELITAGEWWRFFTGHYVHYGRYHTLINSAGFFAVVFILFWYLPVRFLLLGLLLLPLGISLGLWWTDVEIYRGFSGANYGLLALGLLFGFSENRRLYAAALAILAAKIIWEQLPGYDVNYLREEIGVEVAVESHLAGFCTGVLLGIVYLWWQRARLAQPRSAT